LATPAEVPSRWLLRNVDGSAHQEGALRLVFLCEGRVAQHVVRRVTAFAFVVSGVVGTMAAVRAAPLPVGLVALLWLGAAIAARLWARRRRRQHGRVTIDFDRGVVEAQTSAGDTSVPLDETVTITLTDPDDPGDFPRWLLLRRGPLTLRLARGYPDELRQVLYVLRRQGLRAPTV
jgi:hypothetical protein